MAQDTGRLDVPSGGGSMPAELLATLNAALANTGTTGGAPAQNTSIVPLWRARPSQVNSTERINPGQFGGDSLRAGPRRVTLDLSEPMATPDFATSSFLDMDDKERAEFEQLALASGLIKPGADPDATFSAWQRAVGYAANYNGSNDKEKWISPWEAVQKLAAQNAAREGGAYDPFKPRTITQSQTTKRDFTQGSDAEGVTRTLESLFSSEMGRAPTAQERMVYQKLVQKAYDASPEKTQATTTTDANGNSTTTQTASGGIDETATLLDRVRDNPETQAFAAGSTFFEAAMRALGAIA